MDEYNDLNTYNGDSVHDMYVDYGYHINTYEPLYDEPNLEDFDDWD